MSVSKAIANLDVLRETNLNLKRNFPSIKSLLEEARRISTINTGRWVGSNRTDFSFYGEEDYSLECVLCYLLMSRGAITHLGHFCKATNFNNGQPPKLLDIYNGVGLTTVAAGLCGFEVYAFNDNPKQKQYALETAARYGIEITYLDWKDIKPESFDIAVSLEVLEHFKEPLDHLKETLSFIRPGGLLCETTGFKDPTYPGHFDTYIVDGQTHGHRQAKLVLDKWLKQHARKYARGFNSKPRIWVKGETGVNRPLFDGTKKTLETYGVEY